EEWDAILEIAYQFSVSAGKRSLIAQRWNIDYATVGRPGAALALRICGPRNGRCSKRGHKHNRRYGADIKSSQGVFATQIKPAERRDHFAAESCLVGPQDAHGNHIPAMIIGAKIFGLDNFRNGIHVV